MEVEAVPRNPLFDFGCERHDTSVSVGDVPNQPTGENNIVCRFVYWGWKHLDLHLLGLLTVELRRVAPNFVDVSHFAVGVLDRSRNLSETADHLVEYGARFYKWWRGMVSRLFLCGKNLRMWFSYQEKLDLSHREESETAVSPEQRIGLE